MPSKPGGIAAVAATAGVHINGIHINGGVSFAESRPNEPEPGGAPNYSIKNVASYTYTYPDDIFYIYKITLARIHITLHLLI